MIIYSLVFGADKRSAVVTAREDLADRWRSAGRVVDTAQILSWSGTLDVQASDEPGGLTEQWVDRMLETPEPCGVMVTAAAPAPLPEPSK
jgi:hypothetical protein